MSDTMPKNYEYTRFSMADCIVQKVTMLILLVTTQTFPAELRLKWVRVRERLTQFLESLNEAIRAFDASIEDYDC